MTKKQKNPAKSSVSSKTDMVRILFYSGALIVACCAVAVVIFETNVGKDFLAKVRGKDSTFAEHSKPDVKEEKLRSNDEGKRNKKVKQSVKTEQKSAHVGDSGSSDTLAKNTKDGMKHETRNTIKDDGKDTNKNIDVSTETLKQSDKYNDYTNNESKTVTSEESDYIDEVENEWEKMYDEFSKENLDKTQEKQDEKQDNEQESFVKRQEKEKPVHEKDTPMVDMETLAQEEDYHFVEENTSDVDEPTVVENIKEESKEGEKNEKKEKKKEEDEENISVGDSLLDLEKQRKINQDEKKYEPITEPEGPPIDQSPVHVQRGLRGDYGGKGRIERAAFHEFYSI